MPKDASSPITVVGIGASAGGLKALKQFFARMPNDTGLTYVVVMHLAPDHPSHLADVLQPACRMPVVQVSEVTFLEPNHVYVIPPGRNLSTIDTHLRLSALEENRRERAPIDYFFDTLSKTHAEHAIGIIFSGTGTDGTLGIRKIKEGGGLTIVQEPNEAEFEGMPQSAIATQLGDLILPIDSMCDYILRFSTTRPQVAVPEEAEELSEGDRQILQHIFAQLRARTGQDFSTYKQSTVLRRLRRRMQLQQKERLEDYLLLLREHPNEVRLLAEDFLITVTQFFRDRESFEYLEKQVIPKLFDGKGAGQRVRVWSVGCATGEEAYSIAMLLLEQAALRPGAPELQVFASDLHEHSLQRAREGLYPETIAADVSAERLKRFFTREDSSYRIRKDVREIVVFANHNLLRDPPFSHMDLIVCRNVLIYLQRGPQHDVIDLFHYALNPDGFLLLGGSETVDRAGLFRVENKRHSVYRRRNVPPPEPRLPVFFQPFRRDRGYTLPPNQRHEPTVSYGALHQKAVERYSLPSILVNEESQVVHISERAGRYLQVSGGDLSANLFKMSREELRLELRAALQHAAETGRDTRTAPIPMVIDGAPKQIVAHVRPSVSPDMEGLYLVIFDEVDESDVSASTGPTAPKADQRVELDQIKAQLRGVIEQYESLQEEMKAANEELQSTNEELRSAMEELETSKEELQSMNEELQTVNQENRHRVEELSQLTGDLNNLISATEIATLFLDQQLRILRVTPPVADLFNVRASDRGRPLTDFSNRIGYSRLPEDAERVVERLMPVEREVRTQDGKWYLMRILPYRTGDLIKGVVITFIEITERKNIEMALRESEARFRALVTTSSDIVYRMSPDWSVMRALDGRGLIEDIVAPRADWMEDYIYSEDQEMVKAAIRESVKNKGLFQVEHRVHHSDGSIGWSLSRAVPMLDEKGGIIEWFGAATDVTARRQAEEALKEADRRKDLFLATLGHELRNPLAPLRTALELFRKLVPHDPKLQELRSILDRQVKHLSHLVDDLLDVSRIKSGRIQLKLQHLDLRDRVNEAVENVKTAIDEHWHRLSVKQWPEPLVMDGDPVRLNQIVVNLLDNAAKYTPEGGRITLTTRLNGNWIEISVKDNGIGISKDRLDTVFDTFSQPSQTATNVPGLGLGLALVRELCRLHGGMVDARSKGPGKGSEFIVRLPVSPAPRALADDAAEDSAPAADGARQDAKTEKPKRILVVDDNKDAADSIAMLLRSVGHDVRQVYDGTDALREAAAFAPQVVLLDIGLPDIDGYDLAQELKRLSVPPRIIALSGFAPSTEPARAALVNHYLIKPVRANTLLKLIEDPRMKSKAATV